MASRDEIEKMMDLFNQMGAKPKGDTPEQLQAWMREYVASQGKEVEAELPKAVGVVMEGRLRLSVTFSGDETTKGDCKYDLWRYEVESLIKEGTHSEETLRHLIRRSLKGEAAHVLKRMRANPSVAKILEKFDTVYGVVETGEETLSEFYSAKQKDGEDVSTWGCRLEELLDRAKNAGVIHPSHSIDEMLRKRFWAGLQPRLKEASRHKCDAIADFDRLRVVVRGIAHEFEQEAQLQGSRPKEAKKVAKSMTTSGEVESKEYKELKGIVYKLSNSVDALHKQLKEMKEDATQSQLAEKNETQHRRRKEKQDPQTTEKGSFACYKCGEPGHRRSECPLLPECYRCHKRGHVQKYCHLNGK